MRDHNYLYTVTVCNQDRAYGRNVKVPSGFEGNITLDILNHDEHLFGNYSSISIVLYTVKSLGACSPRTQEQNTSCLTWILVSRTWLANTTWICLHPRRFSPIYQRCPTFIWRATLSDNGNFPRSGNPAGSPGTLTSYHEQVSYPYF